MLATYLHLKTDTLLAHHFLNGDQFSVPSCWVQLCSIITAKSASKLSKKSHYLLSVQLLTFFEKTIMRPRPRASAEFEHAQCAHTPNTAKSRFSGVGYILCSGSSIVSSYSVLLYWGVCTWTREIVTTINRLFKRHKRARAQPCTLALA